MSEEASELQTVIRSCCTPGCSALVVPASLVVTHALHRPRSQPVGTGIPARPAASSSVVPPSISTDVPVRAKLTV